MLGLHLLVVLVLLGAACLPAAVESESKVAKYIMT